MSLGIVQSIVTTQISATVASGMTELKGTYKVA